MKITMIVHAKSWLTKMHVERFMRVFQKYAKAGDIIVSDKPEIGGDVLFALHYPALIPDGFFSLHKNNIVIHGADLPKGRGRSPIHWQIEQGINVITLTLFEMGSGVDNGSVYLKSTLRLDGNELLPVIRNKVIKEELNMVDTFLSQWPMKSIEQQGEPSYYPKRTKENQKLDIDKTIAEQFDKIRVADNEEYPLWFEHRGATYEFKIFNSSDRG
jgi:methionyl-tRNA formyltransferase